jgi:hypothetical protein
LATDREILGELPMAAQWKLLTEHLAGASGDVRLTWTELDAIVGGVPNSAVDHYPQWWHGDRPNTRAWRAAGYEAIEIRPGVSVRFVRSGSVPRVTPIQQPRQPARPPAYTSVGPLDILTDLNPARCLIVIPCSASKRQGGRPGVPTFSSGGLSAARRRVLDMRDSRTDESLVLPAWQRYDGNLYRAAGRAVLADLAASGRLVILSGGYGVLDGRDLIGYYNRLMKSRDWPSGLLEQTVALRAEEAGLDVVAFAGATTVYAKVLRRAPWRLAAGQTARLVMIRGGRGVSAISRSLGLALSAFVAGRGGYPQDAVVESLA